MPGKLHPMLCVKQGCSCNRSLTAPCDIMGPAQQGCGSVTMGATGGSMHNGSPQPWPMAAGHAGAGHGRDTGTRAGQQSHGPWGASLECSFIYNVASVWVPTIPNNDTDHNLPSHHL